MPELVLSTLLRHWPDAHLSLKGMRVNTITDIPLAHMVVSQGLGQPMIPRTNGYPENYELLIHYPILRSLDAIVNDGLETGVRRLKDVLATSNNLRKLRLVQRKVGTNIVSAFSGFSFSSKGDEKFPNLHRLELESFRFTSTGSRLWEFSDLRHLELRNVELSPFFDMCRGQDFRHLRILRFKERCFRSGQASRDKLVDFLMDLSPGLVDLSLSGAVGRIQMALIVTKHGRTLRSLDLQEPFAWMLLTRFTSSALNDTVEECPILSIEDLDLLRLECPCLETLALDMPRTTEWVSPHLHPYNRSFPCLFADFQY